MDLQKAYSFSSRHRDSLLQSARAGCFHCCAMDAVLAEADVPLSPDLLKLMNKRWFDE